MSAVRPPSVPATGLDRPRGDVHIYVRSNAMHSMNEALARDRMREQVQRARDNSLAREVAAQRRWHRVSLYARAAEQRHAARVRRVPQGR